MAGEHEGRMGPMAGEHAGHLGPRAGENRVTWGPGLVGPMSVCGTSRTLSEISASSSVVDLRPLPLVLPG